MSEILSRISTKVAFSQTCNLKCVYCRGNSNAGVLPASMEDFRRKPLETGSISTDVLLDVLKHLHEEGLRNIRPTGGEPLLRKDWDTVVDEAAKIGYENIDITTNGILLENYLEGHGSLPKGLSMVKFSLDTHDPEKFKRVTGGGDLQRVVAGIKAVAGTIYTRANRVLLKSETNEAELAEFINFCQEIGLNGVQYLDLVHYNNLPYADPRFFEQEFVSFDEFKPVIEKMFGTTFRLIEEINTGVDFYQATLPNGFKITFKDSTKTRRDKSCQTCPVYCQEGRCLVRIATDGNLTLCPDYQGELPSFNVVDAINNGTLHDEMSNIASIFMSSKQLPTFKEFAQRHGLKMRETD